MAKQLKRIDNVNQVVKGIDKIKVDGILYTTNKLQENARTQVTMDRLVDVIIEAREAIGTSQEAIMSEKITDEILRFVNIFEVVDID